MVLVGDAADLVIRENPRQVEEMGRYRCASL